MRGIPLKLISIFKIHTHIYIFKKKKILLNKFPKKRKEKEISLTSLLYLVHQIRRTKKKKKKSNGMSV